MCVHPCEERLKKNTNNIQHFNMLEEGKIIIPILLMGK